MSSPLYMNYSCIDYLCLYDMLILKIVNASDLFNIIADIYHIIAKIDFKLAS